MNNTRDARFILVWAIVVVYYPTLVCGVWIVSRADDEQYKGRTASRGEEFLCWWFWLRFASSTFRSGSHASMLWWLALYIEALVLFPNIEREGIPQWRDLKGNI